MKKLLVLVALAGLLGAQQCLAFTANVAQRPGYYSDGGGEFTVTDPPDPIFDAIFNNYAAVATVGGGFQTFSIGSDTDILNGGQMLNATLDPNVVAKETAWLYMQFAQGTLPGYDYTPSPPAGVGTRANSAWALQNAVWFFQGSSLADSEAGSDYIWLAWNHFDEGGPDVMLLNSATSTSDGLDYGVAQLLMTYEGNPSQPMLAYVGVPGLPRTSKIVLLGELQGLLPGANKQTTDKLNQAIDHLAKSLAPSLWVDASHLAAKDGQKVFQEEKDAVNKLMELLHDKLNTLPAGTLEPLIAQLVAVDRALAETAIADPTTQAKAQNELLKGDNELANGKPINAIEHYRNAWQQATK
jgi:hypothetical protein